MTSAIGYSAVLLSFVSALAGAAVLGYGLLRGRPATIASGRRYTWLIVLGAVVASAALETALVTHDFSLSFVAQNNSRQTPLLYSITGMWSALTGSLLLWGLILAGYLGVMVRHFRSRAADPLVGWATLVVYLVVAFFFGLMAGPANPFTRVVGAVPLNGAGPNALLQDNPLVTFHPPMLYLGFVGFTIPFAFAVASLVTGRLGEGWLVETRRWTLVAWGFLSIGLVAGAYWSYQVLGWGGFWAWDPVENSAFLPWLTGTAYLHSVIVQERRGILRVWNLSLVLATFSLTILGTFLTRSGVVQSVHAFTQSNLGPEILAFFGAVVVASIGLIAWRGDRLRSPGSIDSPLSREAAFLANNLAFAAFAFVVLLGTVFPLFYQAFSNTQITVGRPYFDSMTAPVGLVLLFLMAVAPVLPWRKASAGLLRDRLLWPAWAGAGALVLAVVVGARGFEPLAAFFLGAFAAASALRQLVLAVRRRGLGGLSGRSSGGMVVHLGVVMVAMGLAASLSYGHHSELRLAPGQSGSLDGQTVTYLSTRQVNYPNRAKVIATVRLDHSTLEYPAISQFTNATEGIGIPAILSNPFRDIYLTLDAAPTRALGHAEIGIIIQPMVAWLWVGGGVIGLGVVLAALPGRGDARGRRGRTWRAADRQRSPAGPSKPAVTAEPVGAGSALAAGAGPAAEGGSLGCST
ncbi:MAG: heme lyase CcmF/NrfE family subunit [Acidimicrobiales bacterium]